MGRCSDSLDGRRAVRAQGPDPLLRRDRVRAQPVHPLPEGRGRVGARQVRVRHAPQFRCVTLFCVCLCGGSRLMTRGQTMTGTRACGSGTASRHERRLASFSPFAPTPRWRARERAAGRGRCSSSVLRHDRRHHDVSLLVVRRHAASPALGVRGTSLRRIMPHAALTATRYIDTRFLLIYPLFRCMPVFGVGDPASLTDCILCCSSGRSSKRHLRKIRQEVSLPRCPVASSCAM